MQGKKRYVYTLERWNEHGCQVVFASEKLKAIKARQAELASSATLSANLMIVRWDGSEAGTILE